MESYQDERLMVVSPDGSCRNIFKQAKASFGLEIKCPFPGKTYTTPVLYHLPTYFVMQVLCEMHVLKTYKLFFHVIHHQKFDNLTGTFDNELWKKLQKYAITLYVEDKGRYPRKLGSDIAELKNDLKYFCKRNVEFLAEVRSVVAKPCCHLDTILQKKDVDLNGHTKLRKLTRLNNVQDTKK